METSSMTDANGHKLYDDMASLSTGKNSGYSVMGDTYQLEKLATFNRERIPERVVHAKGAGAHGYFECTDDMSKYTCASLFRKGAHVPVFVRFSPVTPERGGADTVRDPFGFAIKFYTDEGNYDLLCLSQPVFFVRDSIKFPDLIHSMKRNPVTNLKDKNLYWDFLSMMPETVHATVINFTDRGTPASYRQMEGFSVNTYTWYKETGQYMFVKYHLVPSKGGIQTLTAEQAASLAGSDPDHLTKDLYEHIKDGDFPSYELYVQLMGPKEINKLGYNAFDATKVWFHKQFPLHHVGRLVLDANPKSHFLDVEQVGFAPSTLVPGISFSPDKLLQGRLMAYPDAQRYRLGVNFTHLPINAPHTKVRNYYCQDGAINTTQEAQALGSFPNSLCEIAPNPKVPHINFEVGESVIARATAEGGADDDFFQARALWRNVLDDVGKEHLVSNIAGHLGEADEQIQYRELALMFCVDEDLARRLCHALKLDMERVKGLAKMPMAERVKVTQVKTK